MNLEKLKWHLLIIQAELESFRIDLDAEGLMFPELWINFYDAYENVQKILDSKLFQKKE